MPKPKRPSKPASAAVPINQSSIINAPPTPTPGFAELRVQTKASIAVLETAVKAFSLAEPLPQDLLLSAAILSALAKDFDAAWESLKVALRSRRHAGGKFETGRAVIVFKSGERRAPAWKDEATANAKRLAVIAGEVFDPKLYQDKVLQATIAVPTADQVTIAVGE